MRITNNAQSFDISYENHNFFVVPTTDSRFAIVTVPEDFFGKSIVAIDPTAYGVIFVDADKTVVTKKLDRITLEGSKGSKHIYIETL